jgi:hypothetical protein
MRSGRGAGVVLPPGQRDALVEAEQVRLARLLVLHHHHHVGEPEALRQAVEGVGDELLEGGDRDQLH